MAKRFTDTEKWKMAWFRKLGSQGRDLWSYLHDNCDSAGFIEIDLERMGFDLGFELTLDQIMKVLNGKVLKISDDRLFLTAFIEFQYGTLSASCKPHQAVIRLLEKRGIDSKTLTLREGYSKGIHTLEEKDKDKDKEEEKDQRKFDASSLPALCQTWIETLSIFRIERLSVTPHEQEQILRATRLYGTEYTDKVLYGARFESKSKEWDPAEHASVTRILFGKSKQGVPFHEKLANSADRNARRQWEVVSDAI